MKRAHLVLEHRLAAKLLEHCALTPARFDLMFVLRVRSVPTEQSRVRRMLGVARSTVSRMIASLERLGFVTRDWFTRGATRFVELTGLGRAVLRHAIRKTMRRRVARRWVDRVISWGKNCVLERCELESRCELIQHGLRDTARELYAWPDD